MAYRSEPDIVGQSMTTTAKAAALGRAATALLEEYQAGTWVPVPDERDLADGPRRPVAGLAPLPGPFVWPRT